MPDETYPFASATELRVRCVELALGRDGRDVVDLAQRIYDFVTGASARTPLDKIKDALAEAGVS